jgi:CRISPR-associated protein Csd2
MSIRNRYEFVLLFDVKDGNPNGDPDAGNLPRADSETGFGLVTDVCLKRKIRNYVGIVKKEEPPFDIYIKEKAILNNTHKRAYIGIGAEDSLKNDDKKRKGGDKVQEARQWMCSNFYDVRTFGAVMSTGVNCGQVRGPVQITFARSIDPIIAAEHSITRMAVTTETESVNQDGDNRTMGRKFTVPYGLYRAHGFISAHLAEQTGFDEIDLTLLFESIKNMFDHDRSASRGEMNCRGLYVFKHDSLLGNAPAHQLFERVSVKSKIDGFTRDFSDYVVNINTENLPAGVSFLEM